MRMVHIGKNVKYNECKRRKLNLSTRICNNAYQLINIVINNSLTLLNFSTNGV